MKIKIAFLLFFVWVAVNLSNILKPIRIILLYPWERHFTALSSPRWSQQAALTFSHIIEYKLKNQTKTFNLKITSWK